MKNNLINNQIVFLLGIWFLFLTIYYRVQKKRLTDNYMYRLFYVI